MPVDNANRPFIGVAVMVWKGEYLLLGKRLNPHGDDSWQFPGGSLEHGETISECAHREVAEEVGIQISDVKHRGYSNDVFTLSGRHYVTLFVSANYSGGEVRVMEPDKCECWQWFKSDALPNPLFLPISNYLKQHPDLRVFCEALDTPANAHK